MDTKSTIVGQNHHQNFALSPNEGVYLEREPDNEHDPSAVAAYTQSGEFSVTYELVWRNDYHKF